MSGARPPIFPPIQSGEVEAKVCAAEAWWGRENWQESMKTVSHMAPERSRIGGGSMDGLMWSPGFWAQLKMLCAAHVTQLIAALIFGVGDV